ncbi:MAG TPA: isoaspartyl peptidase/L-asparaginase, partial [Kofleriaceae bacterium]
DANEHAMLCGPSAWDFATEIGIAPDRGLVTERARARLAAKLVETSGGTVGAVARDRSGRFAAATSTGGMVGKRRGRIGDSPIIGAGTWADERCALSATGDGEAILRMALTRSIAAREGGLKEAITAELAALGRLTGGSAGVIGIDAHGVVGIQLSPTMPIAWVAETTGDSLGEVVAMSESIRLS